MTSNFSIRFKIKNDINELITGNIYHYDDGRFPKPLIIMSHGFRGWKDWGFLPYTAERFSKAGYIVICFNFSLNGNPANDSNITNPEKFAKNTVSQEISDLQTLINCLSTNKIHEFNTFQKYWNGDIYLSGHSLGGGVSIIVGNQNPMVKKISLWASIGKFDRYSERQKKIWKEKGFMKITNPKTNQILFLNSSYLIDIELNREKYDIGLLIAGIKKPVLMIHGSQDVTVPLKEAQILINSSDPEYLRYEIVEKIGHTFGINHPFTHSNAFLEKIIAKTIEFYDMI